MEMLESDSPVGALLRTQGISLVSALLTEYGLLCVNLLRELRIRDAPCRRDGVEDIPVLEHVDRRHNSHVSKPSHDGILRRADGAKQLLCRCHELELGNVFERLRVATAERLDALADLVHQILEAVYAAYAGGLRGTCHRLDTIHAVDAVDAVAVGPLEEAVEGRKADVAKPVGRRRISIRVPIGADTHAAGEA